jgi:anti-sigma regulatory factor (Ser/Thr protein kinase)
MVAAEPAGLVHDAFVYTSQDEFLAGTLPFLEDGIARGEPILAAPTDANACLLQDELGRRARAVDWAENSERHRAVERLGIFLRYVERHVERGATRIRLLGEPCWPPTGGPGVAEWKRYESFLNVALARHPVWLVCPYDGRNLPSEIVDDALRTHPNIGYGDGRRPSGEYVEPAEFARELDDARLPRPPADAAERYFTTASGVRRFVREQGRAAGLTAEKLGDAELAASEVAANVYRHAADVARVRCWIADDTFSCEIDDTGRGIDDPFAGYAVPEPMAHEGRGLSIARRVADVVEIRTTPTGAVVRLHFTFDAS